MPEFQKTIISWYHQNKRNLPWRETTNPYFIWLSEIILQQTRIEQGTTYYLKFIKHFPKIKDLAQANEQEVLNLNIIYCYIFTAKAATITSFTKWK